MLRRSAQLLLIAENDHFEGSMHLASVRLKEGQTGVLGGGGGLFPFCPCLSFGRVQMHANFKVIVLRRQEELGGPSQNWTIRIRLHELDSLSCIHPPQGIQKLAWGAAVLRRQKSCSFGAEGAKKIQNYHSLPKNLKKVPQNCSFLKLQLISAASPPSFPNAS